MGLPVYLAMTAAEWATAEVFPARCAYMACQFSPWGKGLTNIPEQLPEGAILILSDRTACQGHDPVLVLQQLHHAVSRLACESVLLDFQRPTNPECRNMAVFLSENLSCPVAVSEGYAADLRCPVFLSPPPAHVPLGKYLTPWKGREIWLEAALCQEEILITEMDPVYTPIFPTEQHTGGFYDEKLCCRYFARVSEQAIRFTLFDTAESLAKKLELAHFLGVSRAVGLYQELGRIDSFTQKPPV